MSPLLLVHASAGGVALLAGLGALLTRKGGRRHRLAGRVFTLAMLGVIATAVPAAWVSRNVFLLLLSPFALYLVVAGWRTGTSPQPTRIDLAVASAGLAAGVALAGFGMIRLPSGSPFAWVALAFGVMQLAIAGGDLRALRAGARLRGARIQTHIGMMVGAFIAATTAFASVNLSSLGVPTLIIWLGPTALLVPYIVRAQRRYGTRSEPRRNEA